MLVKSDTFADTNRFLITIPRADEEVSSWAEHEKLHTSSRRRLYYQLVSMKRQFLRNSVNAVAVVFHLTIFGPKNETAPLCNECAQQKVLSTSPAMEPGELRSQLTFCAPLFSRSMMNSPWQAAAAQQNHLISSFSSAAELHKHF